MVASSQQALKTMDGAAHSLYAYSHPRPPVTAWSRLEYSRASKAEKEMRLKAFRKAKLLEEAVYSSELAELSADGVGRREALTMVSELQSTQEVLAEDFLSVEGGTFRFLLLVDRDSRRLTLSVGDSLTWAQRLDVLRAPSLTVPLRPRGLLRRSMMVNPRLWAAAVTVIERVKAVLTTALRETCPGYALHVVGFSLGGSVGALVAGVLDGSIFVEGAVPAPPTRRSHTRRGRGARAGVAVPDEGEAEGQDGAKEASISPAPSPAPTSPTSSWPQALRGATGLVSEWRSGPPGSSSVSDGLVCPTTPPTLRLTTT